MGVSDDTTRVPFVVVTIVGASAAKSGAAVVANIGVDDVVTTGVPDDETNRVPFVDETIVGASAAKSGAAIVFTMGESDDETMRVPSYVT
jgi:hypothetical protein